MGIGLASGVSSLSSMSRGDEFSGPEEKSMSNGFRGVVNDGARYGEDEVVDVVVVGALEKKKGWLLGSRRAGRLAFLGESNSV